MVLDNFITWDFITGYAGTVIVTMLIVQFLKELPFIKKMPTRYFTFIIALLNIIATNIATNSFLISNLYLMFINAITVTFTATGGYDFAVKTIRVNIDKKDD
jgi:hypothetical protein